MRRIGIGLALSLTAHTAAAQTPQPAPINTAGEEIVVTGRRVNLVGQVISASQGQVGQTEIAQRPLIRSGDLLEFVPGLVATQHSGSGKANQYFLRGFNLDHGTDFATFVESMPVNMRTHGHGQGYTDLNFLIPESIVQLTYKKGPYYADVGDFGSAGYARFDIAESVPHGIAELTGGSYGYARGVVVDSFKLGSGDLLYGVELQSFDGPWTDINEDVKKVSGVLKYSFDAGGGRAHVLALGYHNKWNSPDQIPQRAVDEGIIDEFGSLDTTVGGESSRYSLSAGWKGSAFAGTLDAEFYAIRSKLNLFSNFTYFLDDPVDGDQFEQVDDRRLYGFKIVQEWRSDSSTWRLGTEGRYDDIGEVALFHTEARQRLNAVRDDSVREGSISVFADNEYRFTTRLRSYVGVRYDYFDFDVNSHTLAANSGELNAGKTSFKGSLIYKPLDELELYASYGQGIHSNDARGTTIRFDPGSGDPVDPVQPLVRSQGAELGARVYLTDNLQATAAAWTLDLDSELVFVGDAGTVEPNRGSRRRGLEFGLYYFGNEHLTADFEVSYSFARFDHDGSPEGDHIPGSLPLVISTGFQATTDSGYSASVRVRYFAPGPLIEDDSVESDGSLQVNLRLAKTFGQVRLALDVLNVLDARDHDVDYFYTSRLKGEPDEGVDDIHFHIFQPRSFRITLGYDF